MKNIPVLIFILLLTSCLSREEIDPSFPVETLDNQVDEIFFTFSTESQEYSNELDEIGDLDNIGPSLRDFFTRWINNDFESGELDEVMHLDPIEYTLDELSDIDFAYIDNVTLRGVRLLMKDNVEETGESVDFSFIKNFRIYIKLEDDLKEEASDDDVSSRYNNGLLVLSYDKDLSVLSCGGKCLDLKVEKKDWREILEKNQSFIVLIRIELENIPAGKFSYEGRINVSMGVKLGL